MAQRIPLPLTVSCFSKIQTGFSFLVPAHPGSPGQRAVKCVCVCVCVCVTPVRKKKDSHRHQGPLCGSSSSLWCFEPVKVVRPSSAYNQSWPNGWLKLTASAFYQLWISMPAVLVTVPTVKQNSLHPLSTSSITACFLLDFVVQGNMQTDRQSVWMTPHPDCRCPYLHHLLHFFMQNVRE